MSDHRTYQLLEARPTRTRRSWSDAVRERIISEACAPGANVSAIARSYEMAPSQLFRWRREAQRPSAAGAGSPTVSAGSTKETLSFVEIAASDDGVERSLARVCELHISDTTIRVGEEVCVERIIDLIRAVRRA